MPPSTLIISKSKMIFYRLAALTAISLTLASCELIYKGEARRFVEEEVRECGGVVKSVALVQDGAGNKLTGIAEVEVSGKKYQTNLAMKVGVKDAIISMDTDICTVHTIHQGIDRIKEMIQ